MYIYSFPSKCNVFTRVAMLYLASSDMPLGEVPPLLYKEEDTVTAVITQLPESKEKSWAMAGVRSSSKPQGAVRNKNIFLEFFHCIFLHSN